MTNADPQQTEQNASRSFHTLKRVLLGVFLVAGIATAWRLWSLGLLSPRGLLALVSEYAVLSPAIFVLAYALSIMFIVPTLPLNLGAGFLWGPYLGGLYSLIGSTLGALGAFWLSRAAFGQPLSRSFVNASLARLSRFLGQGGWKVVALTRLNPAVPSSLVNYVFGLTAMDFWTYAWATCVFSLPLTCLVAYLGYSTGALILDGDVRRIFTIVGLGAGLALLLYLGRRMLPGGEEPEDRP